ncbi:iron-containing alcohol dehydrogenase [Kitasatospora acidiphila]|uniref:iron-containing alcohol dehydrogenase n=1 Tax=Kitasatospora acidiphila TaxID=2567942 RepID=UPI002B4001FB|nr:iron-containing alcohol dehydrogenase [Kitasatospora acidiphila]
MAGNVSALNLLNIKRIGRRNTNMQWFKVPPKIYFERNSIKYLASMPNAHRIVIVTDRTMVEIGHLERVRGILDRRRDPVEVRVVDFVEPNPSIDTVRRGAELMRDFRPDTIVALGGGSPMDAAKVMWLMYEHPEVDFADLKEKFFDIRKRAFTFPDLGELAKLVCIPTTSGTGAEVTPFAVITDTATGQKYPLADYALTPSVAIVDPALTTRLPKDVTADTGFDALTHCIETYVSVYANDFTDGLALQGIRLIFDNLEPRTQVGPATAPITSDVIDYEEVLATLDQQLDWLAATYVHALDVIHYMHDKYAYERLEMALHDRDVRRTLACGIAGLAVAADSLSAIKHATVRPVRDDTGLAVDYLVEAEYPAYGNNDDRADAIAVRLVEEFMDKVRKQPAYRGAEHTQSVLTITSNVVYGKKTGATPDGRKAGEPFSPGANPMNGRDRHGYVAAALSVAKLPYEQAEDGISLTNTVTPDALGRTEEERITNLVGVLDGYTACHGFHMNVNVLGRDTLLDAMEHPEKYQQLTIRVSGYAVNFVRLTREQQLDVIGRTFHCPAACCSPTSGRPACGATRAVSRASPETPAPTGVGGSATTAPRTTAGPPARTALAR